MALTLLASARASLTFSAARALRQISERAGVNLACRGIWSSDPLHARLHTQLLEHAFEDLLFQVQGLAPLVLLGLDDLFSQISHIDLERVADGIALRLGEIE